MDFAAVLPYLPQLARGLIETLKITGVGLLTSVLFALVLLVASERGGRAAARGGPRLCRLHSWNADPDTALRDLLFGPRHRPPARCVVGRDSSP